MTKLNELSATWNQLKTKIENNKKELTKEKGWWDKWYYNGTDKQKQIVNSKVLDEFSYGELKSQFEPGNFTVSIKIDENQINYSLETSYGDKYTLYNIEEWIMGKDIFKAVIAELFK